MRPFSTSAFALTLCMLVCFASIANAGDVVFQDDFEGYAVGVDMATVSPPVGLAYETTSGGYGEAWGVGTIGGNTSQVLGPKPSAAPWQSMFLDNETKTLNNIVTYDMDMYIPSAQADVIITNLTGTTLGTGNEAWSLLLHSNGTVDERLATGDLSSLGTLFTPDTWFHFQVTANYQTQLFSGVMDGNPFSGDWSSNVGDAHSTGTFRVTNTAPYTGVFYLDNLDVGVVPEPSMLMLMMATGLIGLLAHTWRTGGIWSEQ